MSKIEKLTVQVNSNDKAALKNASMYLFDDSGKLVDTISLEKGNIELKNTAFNERQDLLVLIGPVLPKELEPRDINPERLKQLGAYQPTISIDRNKLIKIDLYPRWPILPIINRCLITGNVTKDFNIDNRIVNMPVCEARIHICEIDPFTIRFPRIPDLVIDKLLDKLKHTFYPIPKIKIPKIDPRIVNPIPIPRPPVFGNLFNTSINRTNINLNAGAANQNLINGQEIRKDLMITPEVQRSLFLSSKTVAYSTLLDNLHLLRPLICKWPFFWPYFYRCDTIATTYTDCKGHFSHWYWNFDNDRDIYIWIEVNINGNWITVYKPSIACNTYWNYKCGSDINIKLTDSRIYPCDCAADGGGEIVWFQTVGNSATALGVEQNVASTTTVQGVNMLNVGCTNFAHAQKIRPFAENLSFRVLFGDGFPNANATHFRWKKTQLKSAGMIDVPANTELVLGNINKNYYLITNSGGVTHFETKPVVLGPEGAGLNLAYRIPKWDIYQEPGVPAADHAKTIQWTEMAFFSMNIDSKSLEDGLWQFELELGKLNSATGVFTPATVNANVFQITSSVNPSNSMPAPAAYLNYADIAKTKASSFKIKLRIDNEKCTAIIADATITLGSTTQASGRCGFLFYEDRSQTVQIEFEASHPRDFATFNFGVVKGNGSESPGINAAGSVISSVGGYSLIGDEFTRDVSVNTLLGTCDQASFAEVLHVYALATNGSRIIQEYDAGDVSSFAITKR